MELVGPLTCTEPQHWALLPYAVERIERFCAKYPTDLIGARVREFVTTNFINPDQLVMGLIVMVESGRVVGHALTSLESRGYRRVGFVVQLECDVPMSGALRRELTERGLKWARAGGAHCLEASTWLDPRVVRRYGFQVYRSVIRTPEETTDERA